MRPTAVRVLLFVSSLCLGVSVVRPLSAHPVPKENHDRTIVVRLTPSQVVVNYHLELDESRAQLDLVRLELPPSEFASLTSRDAFRKAFARHFAPILGGNLFARLDGKPLTFSCVGHKLIDEVKDHLRCDFTFAAPWAPSADRTHQFDFREANYDQDDFSRLHLTLTADPGVTLLRTTAPDKALLDRPPLERRPGDGERLRKVSARLTLSGDAGPRGEYKPTAPPEPEPPRTTRPDGETSSIKPGMGADAAENKPAVGEAAPAAEADEGWTQRLLSLLLDTRRGFVVLLLLAALFGAVHALTPGHGKTLVAAYLVGERGTVWHALLLGLTTTLAHTGAVLVLAVLFVLDPRTANLVYYLQGLIGGLLVTGLGLWLLLRRVSGQADHIHLGGHSHHHHHHHDLSHDHGHDHTHADHHHGAPGAASSVRWWHLLVLGVQGGLVPCMDAVLLLCLAVSAQRLWLGLPLLLAFSAGLAGVLVVLGISVVCARNWAVARWGARARVGKVLRALPVISAALITAMGLWICYASLHPEPTRPAAQSARP
jgi:ABC-type nickel/cobalt efflux system permease component RcnA